MSVQIIPWFVVKIYKRYYKMKLEKVNREVVSYRVYQSDEEVWRVDRSGLHKLRGGERWSIRVSRP